MTIKVQNWFGQCKTDQKVFNVYFDKIGKKYVVATVPAQGRRQIQEANNCSAGWKANEQLTMFDFKKYALPWLKDRVKFESTLANVEIGIEISADSLQNITLELDEELATLSDYNYALTIQKKIEQEGQPWQKLAHYNMFACLTDDELKSLDLKNIQNLNLPNSEYIQICYKANALSKCVFGHTQNNSPYNFYVPRMSPWTWLDIHLTDDDKETIKAAFNKGLPFNEETNKLMSKEEAQKHLEELKKAVTDSEPKDTPESEGTSEPEETPESKETSDSEELQHAQKNIQTLTQAKQELEKAPNDKAAQYLIKNADQITNRQIEKNFNIAAMKNLAQVLKIELPNTNKKQKAKVIGRAIRDAKKNSAQPEKPPGIFPEEIQQAQKNIQNLTQAKRELEIAPNDKAAQYLVKNANNITNTQIENFNINAMENLAQVLKIELPNANKTEKAKVIGRAIRDANKSSAQEFVSLRLSRAPWSLRLSRKRYPNKF